jgi:hypothetical protein
MSEKHSTRLSRATTSTMDDHSSTTSHEDPWQSVIAFNYITYEVIDALQREQADSPTSQPLNRSWRLFVKRLREHKPSLSVYLDKLHTHWLAEQRDAS